MKIKKIANLLYAMNRTEREEKCFRYMEDCKYKLGINGRQGKMMIPVRLDILSYKLEKHNKNNLNLYSPEIIYTFTSISRLRMYKEAYGIEIPPGINPISKESRNTLVNIALQKYQESTRCTTKKTKEVDYDSRYANER